MAINNIKPIETFYNGYRFRSRLEARWAVFFDALGIKYEYEPEGYVLNNEIYYLPDFVLHVRHRAYSNEYEPIFAEVKGVMTQKDFEKIEQFSEHKKIIVLGSLPKDDNEYFEIHSGNFGMGMYDGVFHSYRYIDGDEYPAAFSIYKNEPWICGPDHEEWDLGKSMNVALIKARQARFEHGETPIKGG